MYDSYIILIRENFMEKEILSDEKKLEPVSGGRQVNVGMSTVDAKCLKCGSERIEVQGEKRVKEPFMPGYFISRWLCLDCKAVFSVKDDGTVEYEFTLGGSDDPR